MTIQGSFSLVDAEIDGRQRLASWRKTPAVVTVQGSWYDLSMAPGNPAPQYYIGSIGTSTPMARSTDGGIDHGGNVGSNYKKILRRMMVMSASATGLPVTFILLDYLLFYPFLDESTTDSQTLTNSVPLPRYATGEGVQIMPVVVAGQTGGQTFRVSYTNSDGVSGRLSTPVTMGTTSVNGTIVSTMRATNGCAGPFLPLFRNDSGVRSIEAFEMISGPDVGLLTLVLVKPLATFQLRERTAPAERDFLLESSRAPVIADDAYLNLIALPSGSLSGVALHGLADSVWN